ncbi:hypothetical protein [uncultured Rothia sp.]|uniref:hypothetical protein n=1 Tax=uncultured Rothia sp. TaxID=316088 RepID=UPI0025EE8F3F|nr:hypothetical protein [uncultured Rothia sp.]
MTAFVFGQYPDGRRHALAFKTFNAETSEWAPIGARQHPEVVFPGLMDVANYAGAGTVWQRDISQMPLAENSAVMAAWMEKNTPDPFGRTGDGKFPGDPRVKTGTNTSSSGTSPIPAYLVDSSHPDCHFQRMEATRGVGITPWAAQNILSGMIPMPSFAEPARIGDRGLAIWDVHTGIIREYFMVNRKADGDGWAAVSGGFSVMSPGFKKLAEENWATQLQLGSSAVARMHNTLGFVGIDEVRCGQINHALAFTFGAVAAGNPPSWPAQMTDGKAPASEAPSSPVHGQWGRLAADVNPWFNPKTGLPYNPLTRLLIVAAKKHGLVGTDTNAFCHAFNFEDGQTEKAFTGVDPWDIKKTRILADRVSTVEVYGGMLNAFSVRDFPWDRTEWAPRDWGRPDVDFTPREGGAAWRRDRDAQVVTSL